MLSKTVWIETWSHYLIFLPLEVALLSLKKEKACSYSTSNNKKGDTTVPYTNLVLRRRE
jgi:hypothetical protein